MIKNFTEKDNYNSIDLAKFILAIMVVMIHVAPFGAQEGGTFFYELNSFFQSGVCRIAVPLFFTFSGYFLYKKTSLTEFDIKPTKTYAKRILYLYLIWSLIYMPFSLARIVKYPDDIINIILDYIKDFFFEGSFTQLWYLNALFFSIILVSLLLYNKVKPIKILVISSLFYVLGLLGEGYYGVIRPLTENAILSKIINLYFTVFTTTRNGLFFGFFFVSLGMVLSCVKKLPALKTSIVLFIVSIAILLVEVRLLKTFNLSRDVNVLISLIFTSLTGFYMLKNIKLKDSAVFITLRKLSTLVFLVHLLFNDLIRALLNVIYKPLCSTSLHFILVLALSICLSFIIMKLSSKERFNFLKKLY